MDGADPAEVWPITIKEAARRLGLHEVEASTLLRGMELPHRRTHRGVLLGAKAFARLRRASLPIVAARRPRTRPDLVPA